MVEVTPGKQMDEPATTPANPLWPRGVHSAVPRQPVDDDDADRCPQRLGNLEGPQCLNFEEHQGPHRLATVDEEA